MATSYHPETWALLNRSVDPEGREMCHVRRVILDQDSRNTVWRLVKYPNGWRNVGQFLPGFNSFRPTPERNGVKLSGSRTDTVLREFAEYGYSTGWSV